MALICEGNLEESKERGPRKGQEKTLEMMDGFMFLVWFCFHGCIDTPNVSHCTF